MPIFRWAYVIVLAYLAGCGGPEVTEEPQPAPPPPTRVELNITAAANINPDAAGRPSPLLFRVYELKELAGFQGADFFALYGKEEALGGDLARKREFMLVPGTTQRLDFETEPATRFVAVFGAFRNLESSRWRASVEVPRARTTVIAVQVDGTSISVTSTQQPIPPKPGPPPE